MFTAVAVFALAAGLAFVLNSDDDAPAAVATTPAESSPAAASDEAEAEQPAAATADPAGSETASESPAQDNSPAESATAQSATATSSDATTAPPPAAVSASSGFSLPIAGGCVPDSLTLLPGSPREYRNGIHEGMDIYSEAAGGCPGLTVTLATPVLAAKMGIVVRADRDYLEMTQAELDDAAAAGYQGDEILDRFRGRQIWIEHGADADGNTILTRYAHLGAIAAGIEVGQIVQAGQIIGFAGESGTPESVQNPGTDIHGHFEIRIGEGYLGEGLPLEQARLRYLEAFGLLAPGAGG